MKPAVSSYCVRSVRFVGPPHVRAYWDKVATVKAENPWIAVVFCDVDGNGESLQERFNHLVKAERRYKQLRRDVSKGRKSVEYAKAQGGVCSVEFKRGQNFRPMASTLCTWFGYAQKLQTLISSREWEALTGDSFIVDVRPMYGEIDGFLKHSNMLWSFQTCNCQTICMLTKRLKANAW